MRLFFIHSFLPLGGAETLRKTTVRELIRRGVDIRICLISGGGEIAAELVQEAIEVDVLGCSNSIYKPSTTLRLFQYLRRHHPHLVQSAQFNSNYHTRIAARLAGIPAVICEEHGIYKWKHTHHQWIDKKLAKWCDRIIAVSHAVKAFNVEEIGIPAEKIEVLHNCFDVGQSSPTQDRQQVRNSLGIDSDVFIVGHVGTLRYEKGHDTLLKAFARFLYSTAPAKLLLIGDGPLRHDLKALTKSLGIEKHVIFTGTRRDIPDLLQAMDLFAFPSRNEALGIALLDAMYQGLPVVAARTGGIPEIVHDCKTGLLIPAENPTALCDAITRLANDPALCLSLGQNARRYVATHHHPRYYVDRLLALHRGILQNQSKFYNYPNEW